jgi:hypothetical protein
MYVLCCLLRTVIIFQLSEKYYIFTPSYLPKIGYGLYNPIQQVPELFLRNKAAWGEAYHLVTG